MYYIYITINSQNNENITPLHSDFLNGRSCDIFNSKIILQNVKKRITWNP